MSFILPLRPGTRPIGIPGQLASVNLGRHDETDREIGGYNPQSGTITINAAAAGTYSIRDNITGEVVEVVADGADTTTTIAAAFVDAFGDNVQLAGRLDSITSAVAVVSFTCRMDTDAQDLLDLEVVSGNMTIANTPSSISDGIAFGVPVYVDANDHATETRPGSGNFEDVCEGISIYHSRVEMPIGGGEVKMPAGQRLRILRTGSIYVRGGASAKQGERVYIGVAADGEANEFFNAANGNRQLVPRYFMEWGGPHEIIIKAGR